MQADRRSSKTPMQYAQQLKRLIVLLLLAALALSNCSGITERPGEEDEQAKPVISTLYVIDEGGLSPAILVMLQGLQGIIVQSPEATESVWIDVPNGYKVWLSDLRTEHGVALDYTYRDNPWGLVHHFKSYLEGMLVYDLGQESLNVAGTLAGILKRLPVDSSLLAEAEVLSLDMMDVRGKDEEWCFESYWEAANHSILVFQEVGKHYALRDYAAAMKAFIFHDAETDFTRRIFDVMDDGGMVLGWGGAGWRDERHLVSLTSERNLVLVPADHARNLSVLATFDHEVVGLERATGASPEAGIHYVTFLMTDGDNVQWQLNDFATDQRWYGSPLRGNFPMGWTISPSMATLAPTVMQRLYNDAAAPDAFICGVSGRGYYYPSEFPTLEAEAQRLDIALAKSGLNALMVLDTDYDAFDREYLEHFAALDNVIGGFWAWYDDYSGRNGEIMIVEGKPFVGIRHDLWAKEHDNQTTVARIADCINAGSRYSAVSVHPWSMSLADVQALIDSLDPHVRVVDPIKFLRLVAADEDLRQF